MESTIDPEDFLTHYGVKGMKWGVRKDEDSSADYTKAAVEFYKSKSASELQAEGAKKLKAQAEQTFSSAKVNVKAGRERRADRIDENVTKLNDHAKKLQQDIDSTPSGFVNSVRRRSLVNELDETIKARDSLQKSSDQIRSGKLTDNEKILIGVGSAFVVGALVLYGKKTYDQHSFQAANKSFLDDNRRKSEEQWAEIFGNSPRFSRSSGHAPGRLQVNGVGPGFYRGLRNGGAFRRPEFTIPKETTFQRFSMVSENTGLYSDWGAYSTFLHNDNKLYGASKEFGKANFTMTYQAKEDVRVPSLSTVLKTLRESEETRTGKRPGKVKTFATYHKLSGGSWRSNESGVELIKSLKKAGYSAIVDDMDAGYLGDLPILFFGETTASRSVARTELDNINDSRSFFPPARKFA